MTSQAIGRSSRRVRHAVRAVVVPVAVVAVFLAGPALFPSLLGHSAYLFGTAGVLLCAALGGGFGAVLAGSLVILGGLLIDAEVGLGKQEEYARAVFYVCTTAAIAFSAEAVRGHRRQTAKAIADLAHREAVLRSLLDTSPDAMLVIDSHGIVSSFSASAERLFGWAEAEVIGHNVSMLMPAPYHAEHDGYIGRYLTSGEKQVIGKSREVVGLRKDGTKFPMMLHVGEVGLDQGRQFTGFVHDLTSLHAANDRTQELRNQLAHVWRMNSLGEMAAILAHELNQPLAAVSNYVRGARTMVARLELPDGALLEAVDKAGDQALRAGEIIRRMRSLIARNDVEQKPESLAAMIAEIDFITSLVAREANVVLRYNLADCSDHVLADRIQIQQVVSNLVRNAAEAMKESPYRILEITSRQTEAGWVVAIEDSGPGIARDMVDKLFNPLTSSKSQGMGLGLSISRTILENHRGSLWVEKSRLGGAAFCFMLPPVATSE